MTEYRSRIVASRDGGIFTGGWKEREDGFGIRSPLVSLYHLPLYLIQQLLENPRTF